MYLAGPLSLRLLFHAFVVLVGVLILAGAENTSIVGANGVLNRVAEDGVLTSWFQRPHTRFGTSYRIIDLDCWVCNWPPSSSAAATCTCWPPSMLSE